MSFLPWVEKYRPKTLDAYVWRDANQRKKVEEWIATGVLPHLLLAGVQGTGKTSLAKLMLIVMGVPSGDILEINASRERKIEDLQDKIGHFVSTWPLGDMKYILLDEADKMSPLAQGILRGDMEKYIDTTRFILTCNYPDKIIPALHSRLQGFNFQTLDREEFISRLVEILFAEEVEFDPETLDVIVEKTYPDLRKSIGVAEQSVCDGKLVVPKDEDSSSTKDYLVEVANLFKAGRTVEARKILVDKVQLDEYADTYRWMYRNLNIWGDTEGQQDEALLIIRKALVNHALVADPEINLAAAMVELKQLRG